MQILEEQIIKVLTIEYENTVEKREKVYEWLDDQYGWYKTRRAGPVEGNIEKGLMIVEIKEDL